MNANLFTDLLSKQMTRREFLLHVGFLCLAVTGVSALFKTLADPNIGNPSTPKTGFGAGRYGG